MTYTNMIRDKHSDKIKQVYILLLPICIFFSALRDGVSINNVIYAIGQIHEYDKSVFNDNVFLGKGSISPRYILDKVFALFMYINGGNWQNVAIPFVYIGVIILSLAIALIACRINRNNKGCVAAILAYMFICNVCGQVGGFSLFTNNLIDSIGIGMGFAIVTLAISFVVGEEKKYNIAWLLIAFATCMHIHEGVYGFATILILLIADSVCKKKISFRENWTMFFCVVAILMSVVPNVLTDSLNISSEEFIYIYAQYRHPGHLIPSSWDTGMLIKSILLVIMSALVRGGYLFVLKRREEFRVFLVEAILFIAAWFGVLGIMYIGVEIMKIPTIATAFVVKFFKYIGMMAVIWYTKTVADMFEHDYRVLGFCVLTFAFVVKYIGNKTSIICVSVLVLMIFLFKKLERIALKGKIRTCHMLACVCCGGVVLRYSAEMNIFVKCVMIISVVIYCCFYIYKIYKFSIGKYFILLLYAVTILISLYGDVYEYENENIVLKTPTTFLINECGADIYNLAELFQRRTDNKAEFITDPGSNYEVAAGWFQVISRRNCYVLGKVIPSSKAMVKEWYDRYQLTQGLFEKSTEEIAEIMESIDVNYILVSNMNYNDVENSLLFSQFLASPNDLYRIYEYKK